MRRSLRNAITAVVLGASSLALYLGYLGYFGGAIFVPVTASQPARGERAGLVAVVLSGDMGFEVGMGPKLAARLAHDGIPVIGVNSLVYFRQKRSAGEAAGLIREAVDRALGRSTVKAGRRVILIGQSFGADMINVASPMLPRRTRGEILLTALVVPTDTINFRASPEELFNWEAPDASALPTGRALGWVPTLCIYGREETDSLCPHLRQPGVHRIALPGGHALHGDADAVYARLIAEIDAARSSPIARKPAPPSISHSER